MPETSTESVVRAIRRLVVFGADQAGAYRELFEPTAAHLGTGVETRLTRWLTDWASSAEAGTVILTGNAGTGKTAATDAYCRALGSSLPNSDALVEVEGALVGKDLSGVATRSERAVAVREALERGLRMQCLVCANEGVLRDAAEDLHSERPELGHVLDAALRSGASRESSLTIINVNRQRLTSHQLWGDLLDYLTHDELWKGCDDCPAGSDSEVPVGCPMRANAAALRHHDTREALRRIIQVATGDAVPTVRETLSLLSYAICGDASAEVEGESLWDCSRVQDRARDRGAKAFTTSSSYYNLVFGAGLGPETKERSPLLNAMGGLGVGNTSDLEVDNWLRDTGGAPQIVRSLAGRPVVHSDFGALGGSLSPLDRVRTEVGEMTFHELGELVSISEDDTRVRAGIDALVAGETAAQPAWRRRVLFEASETLGGVDQAMQRLTFLRHAPELIDLAGRVASRMNVVTDIKQLVKGLNFLVTGFADASEGLIVPEPASLFARNPGSFRPARPAFVHSKITTDRLTLRVPDRGLVVELLDVDHIEVELLVDSSEELSLTIGPRMYQALREAELYRGPVGHGTAEMTALRSFYGRVATATAGEQGMQIADPSRAALVRVQLPYFADHD